MAKRGRTLIGLATAGGLVAAASAGAFAQDQEIYDTIDCSQWTLNSDGTWNTGPNAAINYSYHFPNSKHLDLARFYIDGVDISAWLLAKCGKR
jgi:hypothetical protein